MTVFRYDKTWEGLLTVIFQAYSRRLFPDQLVAFDEPLPLFCEAAVDIATDFSQAGRVWNGIRGRLPSAFLRGVMTCWLSEESDADRLLFRYLCKLFDSEGRAVFNTADPDVSAMNNLWKRVDNEASRVIQFARFQRTLDGVYFAATSPLFNVLPLTLGYFSDRFHDQFWLVYDTHRHYGYYYDLHEPAEVRFDSEPEFLASGWLPSGLLAEDEQMFRQMWTVYFEAIAIKERLNARLHRQNMPVRFWPYLVEKQNGGG